MSCSGARSTHGREKRCEARLGGYGYDGVMETVEAPLGYWLSRHGSWLCVAVGKLREGFFVERDLPAEGSHWVEACFRYLFLENACGVLDEAPRAVFYHMVILGRIVMGWHVDFWTEGL
jgi:hypothetical protein